MTPVPAKYEAQAVSLLRELHKRLGKEWFARKHGEPLCKVLPSGRLFVEYRGWRFLRDVTSGEPIACRPQGTTWARVTIDGEFEDHIPADPAMN